MPDRNDSFSFYGQDYEVMVAVANASSLSGGGSPVFNGPVSGGQGGTGGTTGIGVAGQGAPGGSITIKSSLDSAALCRQYQSARPLLVALLPVIENLPAWGKTLASAIRVVMAIADEFCGANS